MQTPEPIHIFICIYISMREDFKKLEKISKALGDVNRLKILQLIAGNGGTGQCSAIQECLDLAQPSVSHHVRILQEAGLITAIKEGRNYKYKLEQKNLQQYLKTISQQLGLETA